MLARAHLAGDAGIIKALRCKGAKTDLKCNAPRHTEGSVKWTALDFAQQISASSDAANALLAPDDELKKK